MSTKYPKITSKPTDLLHNLTQHSASHPRSSGYDPIRQRKASENVEIKECARVFAEAVVTEVRLEQAWDFLRETSVEQGKKKREAFLNGLGQDVLVEESKEIEEMGLEEKVLNAETVGIGKRWYTKRLERKEREVDEDVVAEWAREHGALQSLRKTVM